MLQSVQGIEWSVEHSMSTKKSTKKVKRPSRHPGAQVCISIKPAIYDRFERVRARTGHSRSSAIAEALEPWLAKAAKRA